jgi:hypothetical protein
MANARANKDNPRYGVGPTAVEIFKTSIRLLVTEGRLLKSELSEKIGVISLGITLTVVGGVLLIMAVVLLFVAAIGSLMMYGFSLTAAALVIFGAVLVLGLGCLWFGLRQLHPTNLMPTKTFHQVQKDFETIVPGTK